MIMKVFIKNVLWNDFVIIGNGRYLYLHLYPIVSMTMCLFPITICNKEYIMYGYDKKVNTFIKKKTENKKFFILYKSLLFFMSPSS